MKAERETFIAGGSALESQQGSLCATWPSSASSAIAKDGFLNPCQIHESQTPQLRPMHPTEQRRARLVL